jgi:hypothetical protein
VTAKDGRGVLDKEIRRAANEGIDLKELSDRNFVGFYAPALLSGQLKNLRAQDLQTKCHNANQVSANEEEEDNHLHRRRGLERVHGIPD